MPSWAFLPENPSFRYSWARCLNFRTNVPVLGVCGLELENSIVIFEVSTHKFLQL